MDLPLSLRSFALSPFKCPDGGLWENFSFNALSSAHTWSSKLLAADRDGIEPGISLSVVLSDSIRRDASVFVVVFGVHPELPSVFSFSTAQAARFRLVPPSITSAKTANFSLLINWGDSQTSGKPAITSSIESSDQMLTLGSFGFFPYNPLRTEGRGPDTEDVKKRLLSHSVIGVLTECISAVGSEHNRWRFDG